MKKKSASQSAFFNLRVLIGLFVVLAGVFLALAGFGTFSALAQAQQKNKIITNSKNPLVPNGFDCSKIHELGIDRQENFRAGAIMIACGQAQGGSASVFETVSQAIQKTLAPLAYGAADVDLVTGAESSPHITQPETFSWANPDSPNQIVVAYNDSRGVFANPINLSGASVSTDGGATFVRLTATNGQSPFQNTLGDPVALFNKPSQTWFAIFLDPACGGQGIGGYKSTTPSDPNSWTHFCVHTGFADDRESGWADNHTSSPFLGRMDGLWNDFGRGEGRFVRFSTDNGATWTNERQLASGSPFIRDVQITGDLATGDVYVAGMNEGGGGFPHNDNNLMFRSTDGGNTWTNTFTGPSFPGPGVTTCPNAYFACMFTDTGGYWRHEGWGEPAAFNHVVSYVYAAHGAGSDPDYVSAILTKHVSSWDDGRVPIAGASQQDAFTDRELVGFSVTTTTPACNSVIFTQPTDFIVNLSDPALPSSVQATDFTVNNIPANSFTLSNSNQTITFHYTSTPVTTQGLQTMHIPAGAILRNSDSMPIFDFTCTFCYAITPLQVTTTVPPVGGTFSPPAPNNYTYDVNFNQAVDPASVQTSDLTVTGNSGPSVTEVSVIK